MICSPYDQTERGKKTTNGNKWQVETRRCPQFNPKLSDPKGEAFFDRRKVYFDAMEWIGRKLAFHLRSGRPVRSNPSAPPGEPRRSRFGQGRRDGVTWRTSVFPQKSGGYLLPVKASVRREAEIVAGDEVMVELELV
jgi:hypothetical protein